MISYIDWPDVFIITSPISTHFKYLRYAYEANKDIIIENDTYGKPYIKLYREANTRLNKLCSNTCRIDVSLSDERDYAIANVIISQSKNEI